MKKLLDLLPNALLEARNLGGYGAPMAAPAQPLAEGSCHSRVPDIACPRGYSQQPSRMTIL